MGTTNLNVSFYQNIKGVAKSTPLTGILDSIRDGNFKLQVEKLRAARGEITYEILKPLLPAFTPSGVFNGSHKLENLVDYNRIIVLDIDKIGEENAEKVRKDASNIKHTLAAFVSPSGDGVKILVRTNSTVNTHKLTFQQLVKYYESKLDVQVDTSGKNVNRLCFLSFDPEIYINMDAEAFQQSVNVTEIPDFGDHVYVDETNELFENVVAFTEKQQHFFSGNRNNFIFLLANNLNRAGVEKNDAELFIKSKYTDADIQNEINPTLESAYKNTDEHGIFSKTYFETASSASSAVTANLSCGNETPTIPEEVYENIPQLLKKGVAAFNLAREKDVFLTGALAILSGCFPTVRGVYDGKEVFMNINSWIIAPPASGKGVMNFSREMANGIQLAIKTASEANSNLNDVVIAQNSPKTLFVPADSSSAAVKRILMMNSGIGIICETEAITLSSTFKQDWGGYLDIVLKAFQHEPISYSRLGEKGDINLSEIKFPKLSVCLSGVPNQVKSLIKSSDDGLFSRFNFYSYNNGKPVFKNVFSSSGITNKTEHFKGIAAEVLNAYEMVKSKGEIVIKLTEPQAKRHEQFFNGLLSSTYDEFGSDSISIVLRLGLIAFRMAMLLTLIRKVEADELDNEFICDDIDFETSLKLSGIYFEHAMSIFKSLPRTQSISKNARLLFEFLPRQFTYGEAVKIAKVILGFGERVVSNYLSELTSKGWLKQPKKNGVYYNSRLQ